MHKFIKNFFHAILAVLFVANKTSFGLGVKKFAVSVPYKFPFNFQKQKVEFTVHRWYFSNETKESIIDLSQVKLSKKNREFHVGGVLVLKEEINNDVEVRIRQNFTIISHKTNEISGPSRNLSIPRERIQKNSIQSKEKQGVRLY